MTTLGELGGLLGGGEGRENKKGERMQRSAPGVPTKKQPRVVLLAAPGDAGRALPSAALTETRGWGGSVRSAFPTPPRCGSGRAGCTLAASSLLSPATGKPARNTWVGNAQAAGGGMQLGGSVLGGTEALQGLSAFSSVLPVPHPLSWGAAGGL